MRAGQPEIEEPDMPDPTPTSVPASPVVGAPVATLNPTVAGPVQGAVPLQPVVPRSASDPVGAGPLNPAVIPGTDLPAAPTKTSVPGASPGREFVQIKYVAASDYGAIGTIEWCEHRNAANLAKAGLVEILPEGV